MDIRRIEPALSKQMSFATGPHVVARGNIYPLRRLACVFRFVGVATLIYALAVVGIAIEAASINF